MAQANLVQIRKFFVTGDPARDTMKGFSEEWKQLSDEDKNEIKDLVGAEL